MGLNYSKVPTIPCDHEKCRELAPRRTFDHEILPRIHRDVITNALTNVARYISQNGGNVTIIAVGGVVNTLSLKSRPAPYDLEFFNEKLTPRELDLLINGAREAVKQDSTLQWHWSKSGKLFFIPRDNRREALTNEAFQQRNVIFSKPGLTVLAAPWYYSLCCKVDRVDKGSYFPYRNLDENDAIAFLWEYYQTPDRPAVSRAMLQNCKSLQG